mgnify:CR=1 FL=1|tara:strand:- start:32315 stop:32815 length:501 start_codon:yes stop_codon:yes gene_type:complete
MNIYHATPYDISAIGFYFETYEEYCKKAKDHRNEYGDIVEEFEIQFIDGDNHELFRALGINQANLKQWFDDFEELDEEETAKATYLAGDIGYDIDNTLDRLDDVTLFEGTALEYTEQFIEDTGMLQEIPDHLRYYFDTEAYARDLLAGGDIVETRIMGTDYIAMGG